MDFDEYKTKVKELFIKNCLPHADNSEKEKYLNQQESLDIIKNCYDGDKYSLENIEGFKNVFDDYSILSRTCRTLEELF